MARRYMDMPVADRMVAAARAIMAQGLQPTYQRLREEIGGTSHATLKAHMGELWQRLGEELNATNPMLEGLPEESASAFNEALKVLAKGMNSIAQEQFTEERAALAEERAVIEGQLEDAREELKAAAQQIETQQVERNADTRRIGSLEQALAEQETAVRHWRDKHDAVVSQNHELELALQAANNRCDNLTKSVTSLTDERNRLQLRIDELVQANDESKAELVEVRERSTELQTRNAELAYMENRIREELALEKQSRDRLKYEMVRLQDRLDAASSALEEYKDSAAEQRATLQEQVLDLRKEKADMLRSQRSSDRELRELAQRNAELQTRLEMMAPTPGENG